LEKDNPDVNFGTQSSEIGKKIDHTFSLY